MTEHTINHFPMRTKAAVLSVDLLSQLVVYRQIINDRNSSRELFSKRNGPISGGNGRLFTNWCASEKTKFRNNVQHGGIKRPMIDGVVGTFPSSSRSSVPPSHCLS